VSERVTIRKPGTARKFGVKAGGGVWLESFGAHLGISHGYGWFSLSAEEWERFKAEGDRLMGDRSGRGNEDRAMTLA